MSDIAKHLLIGLDYGAGFVEELDPASVKVSPNIADEIHKAGALHPQIKLGLTAEPTIEFTTHDIKLLSAPTLLSVGSPVKVYFRALTDAFGFGTGYISLTATAGLAVPGVISGSKGKPATLTVTIHLASTDGDTAPVAVGTSSPTAAAPSKFYTLGVVTVTSNLAGVTEASLDLGYKIMKNTGENGKPYPTLVYATDQDAKLTATVEGLAEATQARLMVGTAETTVTITFRKLTAAVLPANSGGYLITAQKAAMKVGTVSGGRPATVQLAADLIATAFDGTDYLQFADVG